uniref:Protein HGH1 C-terminal domain-containing protein n=1 Tax=Labrus bergylta TaxID=56723 RepID=A0A3Q3LIB4_9LABR
MISCHVQVCLWTCSTSQRTKREKKTPTSGRCFWKHSYWYDTTNTHSRNTHAYAHAPLLTSLLFVCVVQLTATKAGRTTLRDKNVYPIIREFHRWRKTPRRSRLVVYLIHMTTSLLVQVLIGDEPEQGMENLMQVEIPEDVKEKLKEADIREQQDLIECSPELWTKCLLNCPQHGRFELLIL